jgi:toxin FitB
VNGFLLDTNVPSELTRPQADPHVEDWLDAVDDEQLFLSVVALGEMRVLSRRACVGRSVDYAQARG